MKTKKLESKYFDALLSKRVFNYDQLVKISDKNVNVLNRNIIPDNISDNDLFICSPMLIHVHAFGELVEPHLRVKVTGIRDKTFLGFQDMTYEQYEQGRKLGSVCNSY